MRSTILSLLVLAGTTLAAPAIALPMLNLPNLVLAASAEPVDSKGTLIEYTQCPSVGNVTSISISPCRGGQGTLDSPCEFTFGSNYTITLEFTSTIVAPKPRANLVANDSTESLGPGYDHFPYSGQSFDGCVYTSCPVPSESPSVYTYQFRTLKSVFDALTFNVTDGLEGDSFLCAGFPIKFNP